MRSVLLIAALGFSTGWCRPATERIATLNLENYPRHADQGPAAMAMLRELDVSAVAMQEITDPAAFAALAAAELGPQWRFVWADAGWMQRVGLLYRADRFTLLRQEVHRETLMYRGAKPTLEVVLAPARGGQEAAPLHLFIVHLKAASHGEEVRARQLAVLEPLLAARRAAGGRVVFLGDFNSTNEGDRRRLAALARETGLVWASEGVECTNYWSRKDDCPGHALDHVLTWTEPRAVSVGGACETEGCQPGETCPVYRSQISDHCPVIVELPLAAP